jgi:hypothetical protein
MPHVNLVDCAAWIELTLIKLATGMVSLLDGEMDVYVIGEGCGDSSWLSSPVHRDKSAQSARYKTTSRTLQDGR